MRGDVGGNHRGDHARRCRGEDIVAVHHAPFVTTRRSAEVGLAILDVLATLHGKRVLWSA